MTEAESKLLILLELKRVIGPAPIGSMLKSDALARQSRCQQAEAQCFQVLPTARASSGTMSTDHAILKLDDQANRIGICTSARESRGNPKKISS